PVVPVDRDSANNRAREQERRTVEDRTEEGKRESDHEKLDLPHDEEGRASGIHLEIDLRRGDSQTAQLRMVSKDALLELPDLLPVSPFELLVSLAEETAEPPPPRERALLSPQNVGRHALRRENFGSPLKEHGFPPPPKVRGQLVKPRLDLRSQLARASVGMRFPPGRRVDRSPETDPNGRSKLLLGFIVEADRHDRKRAGLLGEKIERDSGGPRSELAQMAVGVADPLGENAERGAAREAPAALGKRRNVGRRIRAFRSVLLAMKRNRVSSPEDQAKKGIAKQRALGRHR